MKRSGGLKRNYEDEDYRQTSSISCNKSQNLCFSSRVAVVFTESIKAMCYTSRMKMYLEQLKQNKSFR